MPRPVSNPPNPWESTHVEWLEEPPPARLEVFEEDARTVLSRNESPDIPFRYSVNPYRGCQHGCTYCYARPSHQYLGFGAGTDFERRIVVKRNAPECLRRELARKSWRGEAIIFSGNTDCYQPLEACYELTRRCLEVCLEFRNPVMILTKAALIRRDIELLQRLKRRAAVTVFVSLPTLDVRTARKIEPGASSPAKRLETLGALSAAGIETAVAVAPVIPGLTDHELPTILERARDAGADQAFMTLLRLPSEALDVFRQRLEADFPDRARKVLSALTQMRGGSLYDPRFFTRMSGEGPRWEALRGMFDLQVRRLGYRRGDREALRNEARAESVQQPSLFE